MSVTRDKVTTKQKSAPDRLHDRKKARFDQPVYLFLDDLTLHGNFLGKSTLVVEVDNYGMCSGVAGFAPGLILCVGFFTVILAVTRFSIDVLGGVLRGCRHSDVLASFLRILVIHHRIWRVLQPDAVFFDTRATSIFGLRTAS